MLDLELPVEQNISILACPVCNNHLQQHEKLYNCKNGHNFDIAKQGYINLLQNKQSIAPGDNKNMINARRNFLEQGYYEPISKLLNATFSSNTAHFTNPIQVVEVGSGDGYYINRLRANNCYLISI